MVREHTGPGRTEPGRAEPGRADAAREGAGTAADLVALIAVSLRRERTRAGLSLTEAARRAGIAKSTLSQLESGSGNPSVETLWALAVALGVPFSRLVDPPRHQVQVIRAGEGPVLHSDRADYTAAMVSSGPPGTRRDIFVVSAQPGTPRISQPHISDTMENLVLSAGRVLAGPLDAAVELGPGDFIRYPGDVPHVFSALAPDTWGVMVMEHV